ncbi:MAG: hypothetical protein K8S13_15660 [Desulfobacula sp.]|uniref:nitrilase-related carbon-nitrogen hydrolase n=1 Tax=Desulfobacula sp. TaxID=2593537 RepID=UPI0025BF10E0|nr:nitrilase-related carbon-nitrogen hydrolase [Desulfobacula sp.]MCD4721277.1 hypothetical protein [Desulfobacula sp.]
MINDLHKNKEKQQWLSYAWLFLGAILMYFSNWTWVLPAATWIFSVFLIRFSRTQKVGFGLLILCLVSIIVGIISMWRLLSIDAIPPSFRVVSGLAVGIVFFIPFLADRVIAPKMSGLIATLVFPCSWVALEYVKALGNGSWGALAYTQYGNLPLMQLSSITGIWGLSFLITWFASIVNFAWEQQFAWCKIRKITIFYGLILFFVFLYGYGCLATSEEPTDKVCIAAVTNPQDFASRFYGPDWTDRTLAYKNMQKDLNYFFKASSKAAHAGAQIVFWQEYAVCVMEENEKEFIAQAKKIAKEEQIYLAMAIGLFPLNFPEQPWKNKLIWIDRSGKTINEYLKLKPAPPLEPIVPGEGGIPIMDTVYCKIASAICTEQDYPSLIRQASTADAQILVIPAQAWRAVDPLHTHMGIYRAIENGLSLIKGTGGGLSIAVDPYGRVINSSDYSKFSENQMISCLSTKGIVTIYSRIGDAFAWLCILGFVTISAWGYFIKQRQ